MPIRTQAQQAMGTGPMYQRRLGMSSVLGQGLGLGAPPAARPSVAGVDPAWSRMFGSATPTSLLEQRTANGGAMPAPTTPATTTETGVAYTPETASAVNSIAPGGVNGNPDNGFSQTQENGGQSNNEQGGPPPAQRQAMASALVPPPGNGPNPGLAGPGGLPVQATGAPSTAAPLPPPVVGAPGTAPASPSTMAAALGTPEETRDPYAAPEEGKAPKGTEGSPTPAPVMTAAPAPDGKSTAAVMPNPTAKSATASSNVTFNYGGKSYTVTAPKPSNWGNLTEAQRQKWLTNHAAGSATVTPGPTPVDPTTQEPQTGGTPDGGAAPPGGNVTTDQNGNVVTDPTALGGQDTSGLTTEEKAATAGGPNDSAQGTQLHDYDGNINNWIDGSPNVALSGTKLWQALGYAKPNDMGSLPGWDKVDHATLYPGGGDGTGGISESGLELDNSVFVRGSKNYIADPAVRNLYLETWRAATALNIATTDGLQDPKKIDAAAQKYGALQAAAAKYGIKFNALDFSGSTGDTQGGLPGLWNTDPNAPSLTSVPSTGGMMTIMKNVFGIGPNSTPEQRAAAFEASKQWILGQAALGDRGKAAALYAGSADMYRNDPLSTKSTAMAEALLDKPDNTPWDTIQNQEVADIDKSAESANQQLAATAGRRGLSTGAVSTTQANLKANAGNVTARAVGDLQVKKAATEQAAKYQALAGAGDTFARYRGGEAEQRQALGQVLMGATPSLSNPAGGVANTSANLAAIQLAQQQLDNAKQAASDANKLGYFTAVTSMIGQIGGSMAGAGSI